MHSRLYDGLNGLYRELNKDLTGRQSVELGLRVWVWSFATFCKVGRFRALDSTALG